MRACMTGRRPVHSARLCPDAWWRPDRFIWDNDTELAAAFTSALDECVAANVTVVAGGSGGGWVGVARGAPCTFSVCTLPALLPSRFYAAVSKANLGWEASQIVVLCMWRGQPRGNNKDGCTPSHPALAAGSCQNPITAHPGTLAVGTLGGEGYTGWGPNSSCLDLWAPGGGPANAIVAAYPASTDSYLAALPM